MNLTDLTALAPRSNSFARLASVAVNCGDPAEISNEIEQFDFNEYLTNGNSGVYFVRVVGDSMETEIFHGDLLVVNRNLQANDGDKIVASINGSFTVKIFRAVPLRLVAANGKYLPKKITNRDDFQIFGVVTHVIHALK